MGPFDLPGLSVDMAYRPLHGVGGDLFDVIVLADQTVRVLIADATGHGVVAALAALQIKSAYDTVKHEPGPSAALAALNDRVTSVMFTAALVDIAPDRRTIRHACGGHPSPVVWRDGAPIELGEGGPFLGARPAQQYPEWTTEMPAWSCLVLFTDGLTEARTANGPFGEQRVYDAVGDALQHGTNITTHVMSRFGELAEQTDDIMLAALRPVP